MEHQHLHVFALAKLLGEHAVPVAQLHHGHAWFRVLGSLQGLVLFTQGHRAVAGDVVVVHGRDGALGRLGVAGGQQHGACHQGLDSIHDPKMGRSVEHWTA